MQIYLFTSMKDPKVSGFTSDSTGQNLPAEFAPWRPVNGGTALSTGAGADPVSVEVRERGFYLVTAADPSAAQSQTLNDGCAQGRASAGASVRTTSAQAGSSASALSPQRQVSS